MAPEHLKSINPEKTIATVSSLLYVFQMSNYFYRKHKLNYISESARL